MLPRLPLDDRSFAEIVQHSRRLIPKRVPEWTDENAHDPGMTFIELFAWLTEMQRYFISRVPDKNRRKFLDLLGVAPADTQSAEAVIQFTNVTAPTILPRGTKLMAEDQMFETDATVKLVPLSLDRIVTRTEREANDVTASNVHADVVYYAFGADAKQSSKLYVSFDRELAPGELVTLNIELMQPGKDTQERHASELLDPLHAAAAITPSSRLSWKVYGYDEQSEAEAWLPLDIVQDETLHLTLSGKITFRAGAPMRTVTVHPSSDRARYWICCTLEESGYEMPPRIRQMMLHTTMAVQRDTLCEVIDLPYNGGDQTSIVSDTYLSVYGKTRVQVQNIDFSWTYWKEEDPLVSKAGGFQQDSKLYTVKRSAGRDYLEVRFGGSEGGVMPEPGQMIRIIASTPKFDQLRMIGRSNGLPGQSFDVYDVPCKKKDAIKLQVGESDASGELRWFDWTRVDDFDHSGPGDRHYVYDPIGRRIYFGNGERGAIPASCREENICLIGCLLGGGERGNVKPGLITEWVNDVQAQYGIKVDNPFYAAGGSEAETLAETLQRAQAELKRTFRAVTDEDYETIARETPGAAVARVQAIPLYKPGLSDYPRERAAGQVSVVVVPYSLSETPTPSAGFLQTVRKHIDSRRLITTEVHVIPPVYIKVTVHAVVVVEPQFIDEGERLVEQLRRLLRPLDGEDGSPGWAFGRAVYKGDIYNVLSGSNGVLFIQDLWLDAEGAHVKKSAGGDLILPPHGLVFSGKHEIELISSTRL
ncbi:putative baseplate assembly protein [Paenibacillus harenae]|uniref:Baseplate assembly protein n=1 Tax=Paenibacillus harenae TaxID=306543 RepID=A0ABT9TV83_PAEHA|nr:putative baseplate assembly protein [Paenibacillus harenae]MDQ0110997.1 hypothetical protein [Paenibacillus harenae]